uniref:LAGLIDADG_2 domain-containing protein n=1 Tax=Elaeophora elaphi TaxID=1147741 RepID=A0A0R3S601_9BILA
MTNGCFWFNNTTDIHESILSQINQTNTNYPFLEIFLTYNKNMYQIDFSPHFKILHKKLKIGRKKKKNLADWSDKCLYHLWTRESKKICYISIAKYLKRTKSFFLNVLYLKLLDYN